MKQDYTHVTMILDRTGSMESIRDDTIGGFNSYLEKSKGLPGSVSFTLVQFDSQDPYEVLKRFAPIADVPPLTRETYIPRASTPLFDAIGRGIIDLEDCIGKLEEQERPAKVIFVIVTDGQENASREFTKEKIEMMIKSHSEKDGWQFVFLSADLGAMNDARSVGFKGSSSFLFSKTPHGVNDAFNRLYKTKEEYLLAMKRNMDFDKKNK